MKKKILIIAILGAILSVIIYFYTRSDEITIVALGDGLSLGMTPYEIEGFSFNDYLKEEYQNKHKLKKYIYEFASSNLTVKELIYSIKDNKSLTIKDESIEIQRAINEADILTIAIGLDELSQVKITSKVKNEFKEDMEELLSMINLLNHNQVIVLGIYKTKNQDALSVAEINAIIRDITFSNNFTFVDINDIGINPAYYLDKNSYYINYVGHKEIYKQLKKTCKLPEM